MNYSWPWTKFLSPGLRVESAATDRHRDRLWVLCDNVAEEGDWAMAYHAVTRWCATWVGVDVYPLRVSHVWLTRPYLCAGSAVLRAGGITAERWKKVWRDHFFGRHNP